MDNHSVDSDELEIYYGEAAERDEEISNQIYSEADFQEKYGETEEEKYNAVFHYNNSSAYVDAVLTLSEEAVK